MIELFLLIYGVLTFGVVVVGYLLYKRKSKAPTNGSIQLNELTLIIPFRNEEENLPRLLECLQQSSRLPKEIIFINDHSEDNGLDCIASGKGNLPLTVLHLPAAVEGKKRAIREGLRMVNTSHVLTMDADVHFESDYFANLNRLPRVDLWILPVILLAKNRWLALFELDLHLINAINVGLFGWFRPIIASGANLLFSVEAFHSADDFASHAHVASGDDIFLLRDFRRSNKVVRVMAAPEYAVYSVVPSTVKAFIHQRIRWIAKTGQVKDALGSFLGVLQSIFSLAFISMSINALYHQDALGFWMLFVGKSLIEMVCYAPYFLTFKRFAAWLFFPVFQCSFPLYNLLLLFLIPFITPVWKGRKAKV